jgi:hypothetical protein
MKNNILHLFKSPKLDKVKNFKKKVMNSKNEIEPNYSVLLLLKSIAMESSIISFLLMLNLVFTLGALGISGDDTFTQGVDESLDDYLSPFFRYIDLFEDIKDFIIGYQAVSIIAWLVLAGLYKLIVNNSKREFKDDTLLEKIVIKLFFARGVFVLFTIIYLVLSLVFYFSYTRHFFR